MAGDQDIPARAARGNRDDSDSRAGVRCGGPSGRRQDSRRRSLLPTASIGVGLPVFASVLIALSAVLSLVTIISIYREGGILKRLRATPLRPQTILTAHVMVKLVLTAATMALDGAGRQALLPGRHSVPFVGFTIALLISTWSILSIGFLIASIVPTARFAQPIGAVIMYPMLAVCGFFVPIAVAATRCFEAVAKSCR